MFWARSQRWLYSAILYRNSTVCNKEIRKRMGERGIREVVETG
jgi:hypothetical protein